MLAEEAVTDRWIILHKRSRKINDLNTETFWLYGAHTGRFAIYLNFTTPGALPEYNLIPGSTYDGGLCFYRGVGVLRALFKTSALSSEPFLPSFCEDFSVASRIYRETIHLNPLAEDIPVLTENLRLVTVGNRLYIQDRNGKSLPIRLDEATRIDLLAITGGKPFAAFLLADAACWELKTIWYQSDYYFWKDELE